MSVKFFLPFLLSVLLFSPLRIYAADSNNDGITDANKIANGYNPNLFTRLVYVDGSRQDDSGNGLTLPTAKKTLEAAIAISRIADQENVILVAAGTYAGASNKNLSFGGCNIKLRSLSGAANTIIDLENNGRFLYLHNGETPDSLLDGFTVRNGSAVDGGAVYAGSNSGLKIKDCVFENNEGTSYSGAVSVDAGIAEITNCRFINNFSPRGGGLALRNSPGSIIRDCEFSRNKTMDKGGAIVIYDCNGTVEITRCKFMYNQSSDCAGAIYARNSRSNMLALTNCLFLDNKADSYCDFYATLKTLTILKNVTFAGAKYSMNYSCCLGPDTSSTLQNCIIQGGILNRGTVVANNNCSRNDLSSYGGNNITLDPQLTLGGYPKATSPCIDAGLAEGAPAEDLDGTGRPVSSGVDIGCYEFKDSDRDGIPDVWEIANGLNPKNPNDANFTHSGNDLTNLQKFHYGCNPAVADTVGDGISDGVKVACGYNPRLPFKTIYVDNAQADDSGSGLTPTSARKTISAAIASAENADYNNIIMIAPGTYAGNLNKNLNFSGFDIRLCGVNGPENVIIDLEEDGVFLNLHSHAWIDGLTIRNGWAEEGGAILMDSSSLRIKNCVFENNCAAYDSGAILVKEGAAEISGCCFVNNSSPWGGAIFAWRSSGITVSNCEFSNNYAVSDNGGAIVLHFCEGAVNISKSIFKHNQSSACAGALYAGNSETNPLTLTNCLFLDNEARTCSDFYADLNTVSNLKNVTFVRNESSDNCICRFAPDTSTTLLNCIIPGNISDQGTIVANRNCSPVNLDLHGAGNITLDPQLTRGGYLKAASPCIDAGFADGSLVDDLDGIERPVGNDVDMGCCEFKDSDGDGIPDAWEIANGLNPNDPDDALLADAKGVSNLQKFYNNQPPTLPPGRPERR